MPSSVRSSHLRAIAIPSIIAIILNLTFNCLGPQPTNVSEYEHSARLAFGASNLVAILIYSYTFMIADDKRAHTALVWLNELNAVATCGGIAWFSHGLVQPLDAMVSPLFLRRPFAFLYSSC